MNKLHSSAVEPNSHDLVDCFFEICVVLFVADDLASQLIDGTVFVFEAVQSGIQMRSIHSRLLQSFVLLLQRVNFIVDG